MNNLIEIGSTVTTTSLIFTEGTRISDGEVVDTSLSRGKSFKVVAVGDQYSGGEGCVQIDTGKGLHVWLGAGEFAVPQKRFTFTDLGNIMLEKAGAEACQSGYGTTDPEWVGRYALEYKDIEADGTLN
jgi:hypothetical protein